MMDNELAPIVVFGYNRKTHLENLFESLQKNPRFNECDVYLFVDGPKNKNNKEKVVEVREYANALKNTITVKNFSVQISEENKGLAKSIIQGVSEVIKKYGKVIVIEDDVIVAEDFLQYMNAALEYYRDDDKIWSVGGFSFINSFPTDYTEDVFFTQRSSSYAWGTWSEIWEKIDWDVSDYASFRYSFIKRRSFNWWGEDRSMMLDSQMHGRLNSWAIRFDYAMWKNQMYNVVPVHSRCFSTGHDGTGTHPLTDEPDLFKTDCIKLDKPISFCSFFIREDIRKRFVKNFRVSLIRRTKRFLMNIVR